MARTSLKRLKAFEASSLKQARIYRRAAELLEAERAKAGTDVEAETLDHEIERMRALEDELLADAAMLKVAQADYIESEFARLRPELPELNQ